MFSNYLRLSIILYQAQIVTTERSFTSRSWEAAATAIDTYRPL